MTDGVSNRLVVNEIFYGLVNTVQYSRLDMTKFLANLINFNEKEQFLTVGMSKNHMAKIW